MARRVNAFLIDPDKQKIKEIKVGVGSNARPPEFLHVAWCAPVLGLDAIDILYASNESCRKPEGEAVKGWFLVDDDENRFYRGKGILMGYENGSSRAVNPSISLEKVQKMITFLS